MAEIYGISLTDSLIGLIKWILKRRKAEKKTGQLIYERTLEKVTLFGQHAIKTTFKRKFFNELYN